MRATHAATRCIVSSKGKLINREDTSYETKLLPFAISKLRISFANSKMSVTVQRLKDRGTSLVSRHVPKAKLYVCVADSMGSISNRSLCVFGKP